MERKNKKATMETLQREETAGAECSGNCVIHGGLKARGRTFKGVVVSKFPKRIAIEFERMIYLRKYERYAKEKTKVHARVSDCMERSVEIGDTVMVRECRPLSKIIHFVLIGKVDSSKKGKLNQIKSEK